MTRKWSGYSPQCQAHELDPYTDGVPKSVLKKQAKKYAELFKVFIDYSDVIERISFWGVVDQYSWLRDWPIKAVWFTPHF